MLSPRPISACARRCNSPSASCGSAPNRGGRGAAMPRRRSGFPEENMMLSVETIATPIGPVHLAVENGALQALRFDLPYEGIPERTAAGERVRAYFGGDLRAFDGLALEPRGTPFQQRVWTLLRDIPAGETRTYGQLAATLGTHPRAVGSAN